MLYEKREYLGRAVSQKYFLGLKKRGIGAVRVVLEPKLVRNLSGSVRSTVASMQGLEIDTRHRS